MTISAKDHVMVEKENNPSHILVLTFSKESTRNMREKVEKLLQEIFVDNAITNLFASIKPKELI